MTNDSSTGGYLAPLGSPAPPLEDEALVDLLQSVVAGITGIAGQYVRPRWQEEPPNLPARKVSWASIGITERDGDTFPLVQHSSDGEGADTVVRHETFKLETSFYGPMADTNATLLRDGLAVAQNREALGVAGIALVGCGRMLAVPSLVKERWLYRIDLPVTFRREIRRTYPVLNLLSAAGTIVTTAATVPFETPSS